MPFQRDLARIPNLNGTYKPGLGAIRKKDKERIGGGEAKTDLWQCRH